MSSFACCLVQTQSPLFDVDAFTCETTTLSLAPGASDKVRVVFSPLMVRANDPASLDCSRGRRGRCVGWVEQSVEVLRRS